MIFERVVASSYLVFIVLVVTTALLLTTLGYIDLIRISLCLLFGGGALFGAIGFLRYMPSGQKVVALLLLSFLQSVALSWLGVAFFFSALASPTPAEITWPTLVIFASFAAAGAAMFFKGVYVFIGAGRGWILRPVYKWPFTKE